MDVEKTMEFIVENLADVSVKLAEVSVKQARTERQMHGIQTLLKIGARQLVSLAAAQKRTDHAIKELTDSVKELASSQRRTDERFRRWLDRGIEGKNR